MRRGLAVAIAAAVHAQASWGQAPTVRAGPASVEMTRDRGASCPAAITQSASGLALVLSGGGARGFAHVGVLRVLDSLGVRPTIVVGTSMGALVGALYAGGLSGREIDSLSRAIPFESLFDVTNRSPS